MYAVIQYSTVFTHVHIRALYIQHVYTSCSTYTKFRAVVEYKIPGEEERRRETNERKGAQGQGVNGIHTYILGCDGGGVIGGGVMGCVRAGVVSPKTRSAFAFRP